MNFRKSAIAFLGAMALGLSSMFNPALATEKGWYLGFAVGQSELKDTSNSLGAFCNEFLIRCDQDDTSTAFRGFVGYQVNQYFSTELAYFDLGSPSISTEAPISANAEANMKGVSISILPQIPILKIGALYLRLGLAAGDVSVNANAPLFGVSESDSTTGATILGGVGGAINLGRNVTLRVEWERYAFDETLDLANIDIDVPDVDVISASVVFRFPKKN